MEMKILFHQSMSNSIEFNSGPTGDGAERACSAHHGGNEEEGHEGDHHYHPRHRCSHV